MIAERLARLGAVAIAVAGVIDPTVARHEIPPAMVALVTADGPHLDLPVDASSQTSRRARAASVTADLERRLGSRVRTVRGPHPDASAWVIVGAEVATPPLPPRDVPIWTVDVSTPLAPNVAVRSVVASPARVGERTSVVVGLHGEGVGGRTSKVRAMVRDLVLAEASHRWSDDQADVPVRLDVTPWHVPSIPLRVHVDTDGPETTTADNHGEAALLVDDRPWRVFVYEGRPSWNVAFARRALESDPRFRVDARSLLSRRIATTQGAGPGRVPASFDPAALAAYDVVMLGTPDLVDAPAWRTLDAFARTRGGAVLVVPDRVVGRSLDAAIPADWQERLLDSPVSLALSQPGRPEWQASELAVARRLGPAAETLAAIIADDDRTSSPVVVRERRGDGQVIVVGALDAWRNRGANGASFEVAWRSLVAMAAAETTPPLDVTLDRHDAAPGSVVSLEVRLRRSTWPDTTGVSSPAVLAWLEREGQRLPITLSPAALPGALAARVPVPLAEGAWHVVVDAPDLIEAKVTLPLIVAAGAAPSHQTAVPLSVLGRTTGGSAASVATLDHVVDALDRALARPVTAVVEPVPVMRSPWWIVPFTALLGTEWWLRRRRGAR